MVDTPPDSEPQVGLTIHRGPNHLCQIFAPEWNGVDHENALYPDVRLWLNGEWVLDHPIGYQGVAQAQNVPLMAGHVRMANMAGTAEQTPSGCKVTWHTDGKLPNSWAHFMNGFTRTTEFFAPNKIVVVDTFDGRKPTPEELTYGDLIAKTANAPALWQTIYHTPVEPTETPTGYTWKTAGGQTVTITATGYERKIAIPTKNSPNWGGWFNETELGGYQIRFLDDRPKAEIRTVVEVGQ